MRRVGIKVLKNRLSEFLRAAAAGETVLVTDRDRVVAELVPHRPARVARTDEEVTEIGVREGWLTPARHRGPLSRPIGLPVIPLEQLIAEQDADREDR